MNIQITISQPNSGQNIRFRLFHQTGICKTGRQQYLAQPAGYVNKLNAFCAMPAPFLTKTFN